MSASLQKPLPISIWQPMLPAGSESSESLFWERPPPSPLGDHHATTRRLTAAPSQGVRRAILFGESAAAGYLYAPHLTPAHILGRALERTSPWEVIDLARTNEGLDSLLRTAERSLQLSPDLWVIYTGNNWSLRETSELSAYFPSAAARRALGAAYAEGGLAALIQSARERVLEKAGRTLAAIGELARRAELPVVLVIPEVSLEDWDTPQPVGWLPEGGSRRWWRLRAETEALLSAGDFQRAAERAWEMVDLDGETCPTSGRLLARAFLGLGDASRARLAAGAEIDAESYATLCGLGSPRVPTWGQELMRRLGEVLAFRVVSLPEIFAREPGVGLPGRELFLDYCHLTRHGMEVAMGAVAEAVHSMPCWAEPTAVSPTPVSPTVGSPIRSSGDTAPVDALAFLGAAIHTAHRLLPGARKEELLRHWLRRALASWPEIESTCWQLVAARSAPGPAVLAAAQQENLASPFPLLLQHGWRWEFLDADLLQALGEVLEEREPGAGRRLYDRLREAFGSTAVGADLTRAPYLWEPLARFYPDVLPNRDLPGRAYHRSPWPVSSFCFPGARPAEARLLVMLRLPAISGSPVPRRGEVSLRWDGEVVGSAPVGEGWTRWELALPSRPGPTPDGLVALHRIDLCWPELPPWGEAAQAAIRRRLEAGLEADLHPVFGDVASLRLVPA